MEQNNGNPGNPTPPGAEPNIDQLNNGGAPIGGLPFTPELIDELSKNPTPPATPPANDNPPATPPVTPPVTPTNNGGQDELSTDDILRTLMSNEIGEDDKQVRDSIFQLLKGTGFDANGNVVDTEGKIVLNTTALKSYLENDTLPLDAQGNAVNEKGEILITKEDLSQQSAIVAPIKDTLETNFGFKLGDDFQVEETEEGIVNLVKAAVEKLTENSVKSYLDTNPIVKSFVDHLLLGGKPENFVNTHIDYKTIDVKQLNDSQKKDFLDKMFTKQNNPSKDNLINLLMNSGKDTLDQNVQAAITYLDLEQQRENANRTELLARQEADRQQEIKKYWDTVENKVIKEGKLSSIAIPIAERQAFYEYLSKPVNKEGYSQDMLDAQKDEVDFDLLVSFLRYKKVDLAYLANLKAKEVQVQTLKDRFRNSKTLSGNGANPITHNHNGNNPQDISLNHIL